MVGTTARSIEFRTPTFVSPAWLGAGLVASALAAWCAIVRAAPSLPVSVDLQVPQVARALAAGLFLIAGVMQLARWRLTDDRQAARMAAAWLLLGAALPVVALVGPLIQPPVALAHATPAARLLLVFPVIALIAAGSVSSRHELRPLPMAAVLLLSWAVTVTALTDRRIASALVLMDVPGVWEVAECVAASAWILLSVLAWRQGRWEARPARNWVALALLLMGMCELFKAHSIGHQPLWFDLGPGLQLIAAAIAASVATVDAREALRETGSRSRDLARTLVDVRQELVRVERVQHERIHDARSAVIGVLGASRLLSEPQVPTIADPQRLHELMAAELRRLQDTLDIDTVEQIAEFELADALEPVVLAYRMSGGVVDSEVGIVRAVGRPRATATALANLLANVRSHAPDSSVTVRAAQHGTTIVLAVDDDGAGIPAHDRERVLQRGVRGSGPGSGLGLYTAAKAMRAQAGSLHLTERTGGGTSAILTLPAAWPMPCDATHSLVS